MRFSPQVENINHELETASPVFKDTKLPQEKSLPKLAQEENYMIGNSEINVKMHYEPSLYLGPDLITPRIPYFVEVRLREVNPNVKGLARIKTKIRYIYEDFIEYLKDIFSGRSNEFIFKTAGFLKRNKKFWGHKLAHIWEELVKVGQGFKRLWADFKFYIGVHRDKHKYKYDTVSFQQDVKVKQVKQDLIKFIPFSLFIIVPGLELLLPAWLVIFPNSIPSQFLSPEQRKKEFAQLNERRNIAAEKLLHILPRHLYSLEKDKSVNIDDVN